MVLGTDGVFDVLSNQVPERAIGGLMELFSMNGEMRVSRVS